MDVKKILLAVDDSVLGMKAAWEGFTLARQLGASVGVIYVLDIANMPVNADLGMTVELLQVCFEFGRLQEKGVVAR